MISVIAPDKAVGETLCQCIAHVGYANVRPCAVTAGDRTAAVDEADTVIMFWEVQDHDEQRGSGLDAARWIRGNPACQCRGPIIVLSFNSSDRMLARHNGDILTTKGVAFLRLPFLAHRLKEVLQSTPTLSETEWEEVNHALRRNDLKEQAAQLRHRSDSAFSTALTALYELEKLSHFKAPERERIRQNLEVVRAGLAGARLNEFEKQVNALAEEACALGCLDRADREMVCTTFERLRGYGTLVEQALTVDVGNWNLRCREAASIRQALKGVLDLLTRVGKSCGK